MTSLHLPERGPQPAIFYVTDRHRIPSSSPTDILAKIRNAVIAGVDFVQVREKDLATRELANLTRQVLHIIKQSDASARVIVNDRLDVALAVDAAGVHLGRESLPADEAVNWCRGENAPPGFLIGVSCHSVEQALAAEKAGASYVFFGPVFDTPSKRSFGPPQSLSLLEDVGRAAKIPVIAIGGVNELTAADCIRSGAAGIAAIRMFQETEDKDSLLAQLAEIHRIPLV